LQARGFHKVRFQTAPTENVDIDNVNIGLR